MQMSLDCLICKHAEFTCLFAIAATEECLLLTDRCHKGCLCCCCIDRSSFQRLFLGMQKESEVLTSQLEQQCLSIDSGHLQQTWRGVSPQMNQHVSAIQQNLRCSLESAAPGSKALTTVQCIAGHDWSSEHFLALQVAAKAANC